MWRNVFIEAALLSIIIFGGFYINANLMIKEINLNHKNILVESSNPSSRLHISGLWFDSDLTKSWAKVSGHSTSKNSRSSISGFPQTHDKADVSGNKA